MLQIAYSTSPLGTLRFWQVGHRHVDIVLVLALKDCLTPHTTPLLQQRHWLPVWAKFKALVTTYQALYGFGLRLYSPIQTHTGLFWEALHLVPLLSLTHFMDMQERGFLVAAARLWNGEWLPPSCPCAGR